MMSDEGREGLMRAVEFIEARIRQIREMAEKLQRFSLDPMPGPYTTYVLEELETIVKDLRELK